MAKRRKADPRGDSHFDVDRSGEDVAAGPASGIAARECLLDRFQRALDLIVGHAGARQARRAVSERMAAAAVARTLVAWLSGGRFTSSHDELHYVIRKPEDPDARVI